MICLGWNGTCIARPYKKYKEFTNGKEDCDQTKTINERMVLNQIKILFIYFFMRSNCTTDFNSDESVCLTLFNIVGDCKIRSKNVRRKSNVSQCAWFSRAGDSFIDSINFVQPLGKRLNRARIGTQHHSRG